MTPRKSNTGVDNLTFDKDSGRYRYRNPITGTRTWFGRDKAIAKSKAEQANRAVEIKRQALWSNRTGAITLDYVIDKYIELVVPGKPWEDSTKTNWLAALNLYKREFGSYLFSALDRVFLADWINDRCTTFDCRNKHRAKLIDVWRFAISRKWCDINEPEAVMPGSGSTKIEANRKKRHRLDLAQFHQIWPEAPLFLQVAMELSLVTLQSRHECISMMYEHVHRNELHVIRKKTAGVSDYSFIRIPVTEQIASTLSRSRESGIASPYVVHHRPLSMRPQHQKNKPHWSAVTPDHLSKTFQRIRDQVGVAADLDPRQRPTFHEIRSLGGRTYRELGYSKEYVSHLMTHVDLKTTEIYLSNPQALKSENYRLVAADLNLAQL